MTETSRSSAHPLLAPCLDGLGKFSHLIDLDFMADLMSCLKQLSGFSGNHLQAKTINVNDFDRSNNGLTVSERLQCCIVAFKIMKSNLDALNVDLQDFFVQLYNLLLEYRPHRFFSMLLSPLPTLFFFFFEKRHNMPILLLQPYFLHTKEQSK
jgi:nucleolar complex protein 3